MAGLKRADRQQTATLSHSITGNALL